jgi:predicted transcriptional regulator YdeE
MKYFIKIFFFVLSSFCFAQIHPFEYDLHLSQIQGSNSRTMICLHGYGANYKVGNYVKESGLVDANLVSFNFPDHDIKNKKYDFNKTTYGTIQELLPAFYVLKKVVLEGQLESVDLYGYSAGGGAVVNILAILNNGSFGPELEKIGLGDQERKILLNAIVKGVVVLEVPLKSVEEIIALRGSSPELEKIAQNYRDNHLRPLDAIEDLKGLALDLIIHFQEKDEIIFNRDDALYIEKFKKINSKGNTAVVIGHEGSHFGQHRSLWEFYAKKLKGVMYTFEKKNKKLVVGIAIKTSNENFQKEGVALWARFYKEEILKKIPHRVDQNLLAVYTNYEGDYTKPFTYLVGCEVSKVDVLPEGMTVVEVPAASYALFTATGSFPESMGQTWGEIWKSKLKRSYTTDFEVYGPDFNPQNNPEIKIYIASEI